MQTYFSSENDILLQGGAGEQVAVDRMRWLTIPAYTVPVILGILLVVNVRSNFIGISLAYVNVWLFTWAILFFIRQQRIECLIPVLALPNQMIAWPVNMVYCAIFNPDASYMTWEGTTEISMLEGAARVQLATLLFWLGYVPIIMFATRKVGEVRPIQRPSFTVGYVALFGMVILVLNGISKVTTLPAPIVYILNGLLKYFNGIFIVVGVLFVYLSKKMKLILAIFFPVLIFFYTLGNSRGLAMLPTLLFVAGILFLCQISPKIKLALFLSIIILIPLYVVIGNVTRSLGGNVGFEDLGYRLELFKEWRSIVSQTSILANTMGRLFYPGGHSIITQTPESHPYLHFSLIAYVREMISRLLPGKLWFSPYYSNIYILTNYGLRISEETSVEVSLIGNFWLVGGYKAVFLGSIALGLFHTGIMKFIQRASRRSQLKALLYLGALAPQLIATTALAFIALWRDSLWALFFGFQTWLFLGMLSGEISSRSETRESAPADQEEAV